MNKLFDITPVESAAFITSETPPRCIRNDFLKKFLLDRVSNGIDTYEAFSSVMTPKSSDYDKVLTIGVNIVKSLFKDINFTILKITKGSIALFSSEIFIEIDYHGSDYFMIEGFGEQHYVNKIKELDISDNLIFISWSYMDDSRESNRNIRFHFDKGVHDCHYPFMLGGVDNYLEEFKNSPSNLLLLAGDPGTGKTTIIKHFIQKYRMNAMLTHDMELLGSDNYFTEFLTAENKNLLIIEDADALLGSREHKGNLVMSKLLNISEGVLELMSGKKIILSTNITNINDIDPALTRPGRCFDILRFRDLSYDESLEVVKQHNLQPLPFEKRYTLAEIFNRREIVQPAKRVKIGLI